MIKEVCVDADKVTPVEFVETVFKGVLEAGAGLAIDTLSNLGNSIVVSYDNKKHYDLYTQFSFMSKTYYDTYTMANSVIDITGIKNNGDKYFNPLLLPYFSTLAWNDLKFSQKIASYQDDIVDLIYKSSGMVTQIFTIDNVDLGIRAEYIDVLISRKI